MARAWRTQCGRSETCAHRSRAPQAPPRSRWRCATSWRYAGGVSAAVPSARLPPQAENHQVEAKASAPPMGQKRPSVGSLRTAASVSDLQLVIRRGEEEHRRLENARATVAHLLLAGCADGSRAALGSAGTQASPAGCDVSTAFETSSGKIGAGRAEPPRRTALGLISSALSPTRARAQRSLCMSARNGEFWTRKCATST
jgi:hypothetical protein